MKGLLHPVGLSDLSGGGSETSFRPNAGDTFQLIQLI